MADGGVHTFYGQVYDAGLDSGEVCIKNGDSYRYLYDLLAEAGFDTDDWVEITIRKVIPPQAKKSAD